MNHPFKKLIGVFLIILIIPTLIFSIYEIGSLRKNEKVITEIYNNQLDAIISSINQYSDDILNSWAYKLEQEKDKNLTPFNTLVNELPSVNLILCFDTDKNLQWYSCDSSTNCANNISSVVSMLEANDSLINKLKNYFRAGYRKIASMDYTVDSIKAIVFLSESNDSYSVHVLLLDAGRFLKEVIDPKIQEITRNKFYITAYNTHGALIYSSDKQYQPAQVAFKKDIWLLNNYQMGIEFKDQTIENLASARSHKNIFLMGSLDIILFLGMWIIYRNVKKQIELSQLKSEFVSNVSHEIRTPLALISMYIETLEMGRVKTDEKIKEYYGIILQETQRLSGIINKILSFSQIESGKRKYTFTETDINKIVCNVAASFKYSLSSKGFIYNVDCAGELPHVMVDGDALADAIVNLIDNAIKYSADTKEISIRTGRFKEAVFVEVADKGIGIAPKEQEYIFDKFYRVTEKNLAHKAKGTGLGLSIVKHMMDAHHGKIDVVSEPGKGSCFRLIFYFVANRDISLNPENKLN